MISRTLFNLLLSCFFLCSLVRPCASTEEKGIRETAAMLEEANLEEALSIVSLDTDFFVSLETLDDLDLMTIQPFDDIRSQGGPFVLRPEIGRFEPERRPLNSNTTPQWNGPYATYQRDKIQYGQLPYDQGSPLDPWGQPYYFFSPLGLLRGDQGMVTPELYGDLFDRYAIVSLGADGVVSGDDIIRVFGVGVRVLSLATLDTPMGYSLDLFGASPGVDYIAREGDPITLKGYLFGDAQGSSKVLFGATELSDVQRWSPSRITLRLPWNLSGEAEVRVRVNGSESNGLFLVIFPNGVSNWADYE